jgi:N-sulfoglucosamine sulfohydrolase
MDRRRFVKNLGLGLGALTVGKGKPFGHSAPQGPPAPAAQPPNFLFLISDDQSAPDVGCYGNRVIHTPHLDRLAREGLRFEQAYVTAPSCSPSRSSILTGRSAHATGTARLHAPLRANQKTILEYLKGAGYYTGAYRKVHQGEAFLKRWDFYGAARPYEEFFQTRPKDRPFYLHIGFHDPHRPYWPGAFHPPTDPAKVAVPEFLPDTPQVRKDLAHYYNEIARMDGNAGKILALLEEEGLAGNTLVIFTSDNGMPFPGAKGTLYDPGIHVPLIARWPGTIKPGQVSADLVSLIDLPPTWLEAAGVAVPEIMEGRSLLGGWRGESYQPREAIFAERNWHNNLDLIRAVRTQRYKLIQNYRPEVPYRPVRDLKRSPTWESILELKEAGKLSPQQRQRFFARPRPPVELYDLEQDAGETKNLAPDAAHAETVHRLQLMLGEWMNSTNDFLPPPLAAYEGS